MQIVKRIFWGLFFTAAATLVLASSFGYIDLGINAGLLIAVIALGAVAIYSALHLFWAGLFFLAATIATILSNADLGFTFSGSEVGSLFLAATLLSLAFHIAFGRLHVKCKIKKSHKSPRTEKCACVDANFGGSVKYFNEEDFESATIDCNFGNVKAYFDNAKLKGNTATINIDCNCGAVELYLPKTWRIENKIKESFSATIEKNEPKPLKDAPAITLSGDLNFASLTIIYV